MDPYSQPQGTPQPMLDSLSRPSGTLSKTKSQDTTYNLDSHQDEAGSELSFETTAPRVTDKFALNGLSSCSTNSSDLSSSISEKYDSHGPGGAPRPSVAHMLLPVCGAARELSTSSAGLSAPAHFPGEEIADKLSPMDCATQQAHCVTMVSLKNDKL